MASITVSSFLLSPVFNCSFKLNALPLRGEGSFASFTHPTLRFRVKLGAVRKVTGAMQKQLPISADQGHNGELKSTSRSNDIDTVEIIQGTGIRAEEENSESHSTVENASAEKKIVAAAPSHKFKLSVIPEACCSFFLCLYVMTARIYQAFRYHDGLHW